MDARAANAPARWDRLWAEEGEESWRGEALKPVYDRIERLLPPRAFVSDIGGGIGLLARQLRHKAEAIQIWDHSAYAIAQATEAGFGGFVVDLERAPLEQLAVLPHEVVIATEVIEHLSPEARDRVLAYAARAGRAFFSVPNDRLGPDEEPQHTIKFTAMSLKRELQRFFPHVRIEVYGPYLLGVCGFPKSFTLSMTMPVRDEEADIERTLASFRGAADEIVIGIDPRSKDRTREICEKYADVVFDLESPQGPPEDRMPDGGVHFAWIRNQCLERCTSDWIFMTEGHESLHKGQDVLLSLDQVPEAAKLGYVLRTDGRGQQWGFPWLTRSSDKRLRYTRSTHNDLTIPPDAFAVRLPQVQTLHERVHARSMERAEQRKLQNRIDLMDDWLERGSEHSLYYLASEWREHDGVRAERYFQELLRLPAKNGAMRYQARLILAKMLAQKERFPEAREVLLGCTNEDWSRIEHWIWLGDLASKAGAFEEAVQFYLYATTRIGNPPFTLWWIDTSHYSFLPAQRLVSAYCDLGDVAQALYWARKSLELLPEYSSADAFEESKKNIVMLEEALHATP